MAAAPDAGDARLLLATGMRDRSDRSQGHGQTAANVCAPDTCRAHRTDSWRGCRRAGVRPATAPHARGRGGASCGAQASSSAARRSAHSRGRQNGLGAASSIITSPLVSGAFSSPSIAAESRRRHRPRAWSPRGRGRAYTGAIMGRHPRPHYLSIPVAASQARPPRRLDGTPMAWISASLRSQ